PAASPALEVNNPMLDALVYGDNDLVGLVAYAMHEVHRRDWCRAYEKSNARLPAEADLNAYLVGEQLDRRIEAYRRLAEDALAKVASGNTDMTMRRLAEGVPEVTVGHIASVPPLAAPAEAAAAAPVADAAPAQKAEAHAPQPTLASTPATPPAATIPTPATALIRQPMLGATPADKAIVPIASGKTTKLIAYLGFLLVAVIMLALLMKWGMDITQPTR
ncbi:MAG TPA: hypothetical protein PLQ11_08855, partial [Beijerinckiaceae bacterium]|nr:hypothetical protein [Beijerinckiaceae bacterium]